MENDKFKKLRSEKNGRDFLDNIFKYSFLNENFCIWNELSLKYIS